MKILLTGAAGFIGMTTALKLLARDDKSRPQDAGDLRSLLAVATSVDLDAAREAVKLITQRGFHRQRPLEALLDEALMTMKASPD